jgi:hypothetical protein
MITQREMEQLVNQQITDQQEPIHRSLDLIVLNKSGQSLLSSFQIKTPLSSRTVIEHGLKIPTEQVHIDRLLTRASDYADMLKAQIIMSH